MDVTDKVLTAHEASLICGLPKESIERLAKHGKIEGYQIQWSPRSWCWLISKNSFKKFLSTHGFYSLLFCFLFGQVFWGLLNGAISYAEEANSTTEWTKDEQQMHDSLKEVRPGASESEIQEVMGHALLMSNNQWQRAAVHFKRAVQLDPKRFKAWYELGLIHIGTKQGDEYFKKSTEANPNFAPAWYWLGYEFCRAGKDSEAISFCEKYLRVAKGSEETDRIKTAQKILKELQSGKPGDEVEKLRTQGR